MNFTFRTGQLTWHGGHIPENQLFLKGLKHGAILYNEAEVFSPSLERLSMTFTANGKNETFAVYR